MELIDRLRFVTGWNDTEYALRHDMVNDEPSYNWCERILGICRESIATLNESHNRAYYYGSVAAIKAWRKHGKIARIER